ncbi:hypothetical protein CYY_006904 [Polysphondylium violaceum]|uniref:Uncharacterized protein n=1 Tax=Polysphondylium violaceum TaxID=133409 RepID=A0A8J4UR86_9MYCE|nr:hypothetical protein CYY_006904 [Polysphondylium violaceum]
MKDSIAWLLERDKQKDKDIKWLQQKINDIAMGNGEYRKRVYNKHSTKSEQEKIFIALTCASAMSNYYLEVILMPLLQIKYGSVKKPSCFIWRKFRDIFDTDNEFKSYASTNHGIDLVEVRRLKKDVDYGEDDISIADILKAVEDYKESLPSHKAIVESLLAQVKADILEINK